MTITRAPRLPRVPRWLDAVTRAGVGQAIAALLIFGFSEISILPFQREWQDVLVDAALCLFAGMSGRWPMLGSVGTGVVLMLFPFVHLDVVPPAIFAILIPVVTLAATEGSRRRQLFFTLWYAIGAVVAALPGVQGILEYALTITVWVVLVGGCWVIGHTISRLQRETEVAAERRVQALSSQRRSIARDLHDTVAYATSTMIMRAEEAKLRVGQTDRRLVEDLDFIIATGRRSVRDLRGMLEALRRNDPSFDLEADDPGPWRIVRLSDVLEQRRAELEQHGFVVSLSAPDNVDDLPDSLREALGKLTVEATSNMVKHARPPGPCRIMIDVQDGMLEAMFTNPSSPPSVTDGGGLGVLGATERVEALGGELEAKYASGVWILRVQLPLGE